MLQANWNQHKALCKALDKMENNAAYRATLRLSFSEAPTTDTGFVNMIAEENCQNQLSILGNLLKRKVTTLEQNLIAFDPRCIAW